MEISRIQKIIQENQRQLLEGWHDYFGRKIDLPYAESVMITEDTLNVDLSDGRTISVPLTWFPRLVYATQEQLDNWRLIGRGHGIHWDDIDEDISIEGLIAGRPSGESQSSFKKWLEAHQ